MPTAGPVSPLSTSAQAPPSSRSTYVRRNVIRLLISLAVLIGGLLALSSWFSAELNAAAQAAFEAAGIGGLALLVLLADCFTSPIPPDIVLLIIAASPLRDSAVWLVPLAGLTSALAGAIGYGLALHVSRWPWLDRRLGNFRERHQAHVLKYGRLAIALGALTPIPFSVTCWSAGAMRMPTRQFLPLTLLRVPRYVVFYWIILYTKQLSETLGAP